MTIIQAITKEVINACEGIYAYIIIDNESIGAECLKHYSKGCFKLIDNYFEECLNYKPLGA